MFSLSLKECFWFKLIFGFVTLFEFWIPGVLANSKGPSSLLFCDQLIPLHAVPSQTDAAPYALTLSTQTVVGMQPVDITLKPTGTEELEGFAVQVRKPDGKPDAFGTFDATKSTSDEVKTLACFRKQDSTVTHTNAKPKQSVAIHWIAPTDPGEYQVYYAVVHRKSIYWAPIAHPDKITVTGTGSPPMPSSSPPPLQPPPPPPPPPDKMLVQQLNQLYGECGTTAGCFGLPENCIKMFSSSQGSNTNAPCKILVSWKKNDQKENEFTLAGELVGSHGYIAVGISTDAGMGSDSVVGCTVLKAGDIPVMKRYYNVDGDYRNEAWTADENLGLQPVSSTNFNGHLICKFKQTNHRIDDIISVNFDTKKYFYLLAKGEFPTQTRALGIHPGNSGSASVSVGIEDYRNVEAGEVHSLALFVRLHGTFMLLAWIPFVSIAMFVARYFKQTLRSKVLLDRPLWFIIHVTSVTTAAIFTLVGFVLMIVFRGPEFDNPHAILGLTLVVLGVPQGICPLFRNRIPNRSIFTWSHFIFGVLLYILSIACMLLAQNQTVAKLKGSEWVWLHGGTIVFSVLMHGGMTYITYWADGKLEVEPESRYRSLTPGPMPPNGVFGVDVPGTKYQFIMLGIYVFGMFSGSVLLSTVVWQLWS